MANKAQAPLLKARGQRIGDKGYWGYDPDILKFIMKECGKAYS